MERRKYDINKDSDFTVPFRILEIFIFLTYAAFLIRKPGYVNGFIPGSWLDLLAVITMFGMIFYFLLNAYYRIRHKLTDGAFLMIDYGIVASGGFLLGVIVTLFTIQLL